MSQMIDQHITYQWGWARVDKLMLCSRRHDHEITGFDILVLTIDRGLTRPTGERQGLIYSVHLVSDIASDGNRHKHHLRVKSRPQHLTELPGRAR